MSRGLLNEPVQLPFGQNAAPRPDCSWVNNSWGQGYGITKQIKAAGRPMISGHLQLPGHLAGYKCKRSWSPVGTSIVPPSTAFNSVKPPVWNPSSPERPSSAARCYKSAYHVGWQGYSTPQPTRAAGVSGPTSSGAWKPPSTCINGDRLRASLKMVSVCCFLS